MERFSEHTPLLRRLLGENEQFAELCTNYGEAVEAIRHWSSSDDATARERIEEFQKLRDELEEELRTELVRAHDEQSPRGSE